MSKQSEQTKQLEYQAAIAERNVQAKQLRVAKAKSYGRRAAKNHRAGSLPQ